MKGGKQNLKLKGGENIREHKKYPEWNTDSAGHTDSAQTGYI